MGFHVFRDVKGTQKRERSLGLHPNEKDLESQVWQVCLAGCWGNTQAEQIWYLPTFLPQLDSIGLQAEEAVGGGAEGGAVPGGSLDGVAFWVFNL